MNVSILASPVIIHILSQIFLRIVNVTSLEKELNVNNLVILAFIKIRNGDGVKSATPPVWNVRGNPLIAQNAIITL